MADAQLIASLKLDDSNFKKGMSDAERSAKQFEADVNKAASSADNFEKELTQVGNSAKSSAIDIKESSTAAYDLGNILGTSIKAGAASAVTSIMAVGAAAGTAFYLFKNEAQRAADILNTAYRLNVNTDDLQAFQFAAERVGLSVDNVNDILKDVNDRMGDIAINGGGEMVDVFKTLNLDVAEFIGKDPISVVKGISEALKTASAQQKTQVFEAMGNDLSFLMPLLYEMDTSLADAMQTARDLGVVISNVDLNAYYEFNSQLDEASTKISNMKTIVFANLAEPMKEVISYINEMIQEAGGFEQVANDIANGVVEGIMMAVDAADFLAKAFNIVAGIVEGVLSGILLIVRGMLEAAEYATKYTVAGKAADAALGGDLSKGLEAAQQKLDKTIGDARTLSVIIEDVANKNTKVDQISDGIKSRLEKGREKMNINNAAKLEAPKLEDEVQKLEQALNEATKAFVEAQAAGKDASAEFTAKQAAQEALDTAKAKLTDVNKQLNPRNFGQNDAGSTKEQYLSNQLLDKQKQHATELDKQQKDLLRQQQQSLKDNARLESDAARLQQDNTRADKQSSEVMRQAVDTFARTTDGKVANEPSSGMSFYSGSQGNGGVADASNMQNLGILYIASQDGKQMAKVFADPVNVKIIKQIAVQGINEMVRDGAAGNS